jgi:hypothetical protein
MVGEWDGSETESAGTGRGACAGERRMNAAVLLEANRTVLH